MKNIQKYIKGKMNMMNMSSGWRNIKNVYDKLNVEDYDISSKFNYIGPVYIKTGDVMSVTKVKLGYDNFGDYMDMDNYVKVFNDNETHVYKQLSDGMRLDHSKHWFMILNNNEWESHPFSLDEVKDIVKKKESSIYSIVLTK